MLSFDQKITFYTLQSRVLLAAHCKNRYLVISKITLSLKKSLIAKITRYKNRLIFFAKLTRYLLYMGRNFTTAFSQLPLEHMK